MTAGWRGYFEMCPDFWVNAGQIMAEGETLLLTGETGGTIDGTRWRIPAAWKAVIRNDTVIESTHRRRVFLNLLSAAGIALQHLDRVRRTETRRPQTPIG